MSDCLFCKIAEGSIPSKKVHEDEAFFAIEDINPQAPVHLLLIPRKHVANTLDLAEEDCEPIGRIHLLAAKLARERGIAEDGFRIVLNTNAQAGQSVFHIHFHLLGGRPMGWPPG